MPGYRHGGDHGLVNSRRGRATYQVPCGTAVTATSQNVRGTGCIPYHRGLCPGTCGKGPPLLMQGAFVKGDTCPFDGASMGRAVFRHDGFSFVPCPREKRARFAIVPIFSSIRPKKGRAEWRTKGVEHVPVSVTTSVGGYGRR